MATTKAKHKKQKEKRTLIDIDDRPFTFKPNRALCPVWMRTDPEAFVDSATVAIATVAESSVKAMTQQTLTREIERWSGQESLNDAEWEIEDSGVYIGISAADYVALMRYEIAYRAKKKTKKEVA